MNHNEWKISITHQELQSKAIRNQSVYQIVSLQVHPRRTATVTTVKQTSSNNTLSVSPGKDVVHPESRTDVVPYPVEKHGCHDQINSSTP